MNRLVFCTSFAVCSHKNEDELSIRSLIKQDRAKESQCLKPGPGLGLDNSGLYLTFPVKLLIPLESIVQRK